jgi:hypothetical protein
MADQETLIDKEELEDYGDNSGGYEILAQMIKVDPSIRDIKLIPRCRQELIAEVDTSERTVDRRLTDAHKELEILKAESGVGYDQFGDLRRVYRIRPDRVNRELLEEIKIKAYMRSHYSNRRNYHTDVTGGTNVFYQYPSWEEFLENYLEK